MKRDERKVKRRVKIKRRRIVGEEDFFSVYDGIADDKEKKKKKNKMCYEQQKHNSNASQVQSLYFES